MSERKKKKFISVEEFKRREKISKTLTGIKRSKETRQKMSTYSKNRTKEHRRKLSEALKGKKLSEEHRRNMSEAKKGTKRSVEVREKLKIITTQRHVEEGSYFGGPPPTGEKHHSWKDGASFKPYCSKFNNPLKEKIRNRDNRKCRLCGKSELFNGRRLDVHHIDGNKMQGCSGIEWYLAALCRSCNAKTDTVEKEFLIVTNMGI